MRGYWLRNLLVATVLVLSACTTPPKPAGPYFTLPENVESLQQETAWWACRFRINWPDDQLEPDFPVDLMIAHRVIKPVLDQYHADLLWWRFHRRAARQSPGHQFSFLFYSDRKTAGKIIESIAADPLLAAALKRGVVKKFVHSKLDRIEKTGVEDFSDPNWPPEIQRTWPTYIMGVSAFWLALIDDRVQQYKAIDIPDPDNSDLDKILGEYHEVDQQVSRLWKEQGQHALLHHLSAIFGYKPMLLRKEIKY